MGVHRTYPLRKEAVEKQMVRMGLSEDELAQRAIIDVKTLKRMLNKGREAFLGSIRKLAKALDVLDCTILIDGLSSDETRQVQADAAAGTRLVAIIKVQQKLLLDPADSEVATLLKRLWELSQKQDPDDVLRMTPGCTEIAVDLSKDDLLRLQEALRAGKLDGLGVISITSELGTVLCESREDGGQGGTTAHPRVSRRFFWKLGALLLLVLTALGSIVYLASPRRDRPPNPATGTTPPTARPPSDDDRLYEASGQIARGYLNTSNGAAVMGGGDVAFRQDTYEHTLTCTTPRKHGLVYRVTPDGARLEYRMTSPREGVLSGRSTGTFGNTPGFEYFVVLLTDQVPAVLLPPEGKEEVSWLKDAAERLQTPGVGRPGPASRAAFDVIREALRRAGVALQPGDLRVDCIDHRPEKRAAR